MPKSKQAATEKRFIASSDSGERSVWKRTALYAVRQLAAQERNTAEIGYDAAGASSFFFGTKPRKKQIAISPQKTMNSGRLGVWKSSR